MENRRSFLSKIFKGAALIATGAVAVNEMVKEKTPQDLVTSFADAGMNEGMIHEAMAKEGYRLKTDEDGVKNWVKINL